MIFSRLVTFYTQLLAGRGTHLNIYPCMVLRSVQLSLGLVGIYFLARGLETSTFGQSAILLSVVAICTIVTFPGLNSAIAQCTARGSTGIYRHALRLGLSVGFVGSVVCIGAWFYFSVSEPNLATAFLFAAILFPVSHGLLQCQC
jgi:O-antigen/teichoic acid export membrane protein